MTEDILILVDDQDREIGYGPKLEVHQKGSLHRAFSILLFNASGELLLQRRAEEKYHSPGLWTNTCCSHPLQGEDMTQSLQKRLHFEMGMRAPLDFLFHFQYRAEFDNGLIEHELDHVFAGITDAEPSPNAAEVADWKWISIEKLAIEMQSQPEQFTPWFRILMERYRPEFKAYLNKELPGKS